VISFLIQRAKCRNCKKSISAQYVAVELFTGLLFYMGAKFFVMNFSAVMHPVWFFLKLFVLILIMSYLVLIIVYDLRTKKVPLVWFISLVIWSLLYLGISYRTSGFSFGWYDIWFHISGIIIAFPFFIMWIVSKGAWMGFADIEIIAWMGIFLGIYNGASATLIAFYSGAFFAIFFILYKLLKRQPYSSIRKVHIPFTPFLLLAWFGTFIFSFDIFSLLSGLFM
jgi:prepilin signal peptidase PulO-like enzyme (type II secretory pathway)